LILYEQGGYYSRGTWQLGHLYLTDRRLLFQQTTRTMLDVSLQSIVGVAAQRGPYFLLARDCLRVSYRHKGLGRAKALIAVAHLTAWLEWISATLLEQGVDLGEIWEARVEEQIEQVREDAHSRDRRRLGRSGLESIRTTLQLRREEILAEHLERVDQGSEILTEEVLAEIGVEVHALEAQELDRVSEILSTDVAKLGAPVGADGLPMVDWDLAQARRDRALELAGEKPPRMGIAEVRRRRLQEIATEVGDLAAARRDRALDRMPGSKAPEDWRQEIERERLARAQKGRVLPAIEVNLDGPLAGVREERAHGMVPEGKSEEGWRQELTRERLARAQEGRAPVVEINEDSPLTQARQDRAQGKVPPHGEDKEVVKVRIEQARRRAMEGIYGLDRAAPPGLKRSDVAQARRERVQEILAEIHADYPDRIGEEEVNEVSQALDPATRAVVEYLWENRYARIEELRELIGETSHMNVLLRIRETINPAAREMLGKPLLVFERSRIDEETGRKITYSWWLSREVERGPVEPDGLVDIFDEDDHVMVIMELANVEENDVQVRVEDQRLVVRAGDRSPIEVRLPARVDGTRVTTHYQNNILRVQAGKVT